MQLKTTETTEKLYQSSYWTDHEDLLFNAKAHVSVLRAFTFTFPLKDLAHEYITKEGEF